MTLLGSYRTANAIDGITQFKYEKQFIVGADECCVYRLPFRDCKQFCGAHYVPNKLNCHQSNAHKHPKPPRYSMRYVEAAEKY